MFTHSVIFHCQICPWLEEAIHLHFEEKIYSLVFLLFPCLIPFQFVRPIVTTTVIVAVVVLAEIVVTEAAIVEWLKFASSSCSNSNGSSGSISSSGSSSKSSCSSGNSV